MGVGKIQAAQHVWKFLSPLPSFWRLHQVIRSFLLPFAPLLEQLPARNADGRPTVLLDLGCGHGIFLSLAKRERPDLEIVGLDLSDEKIEGARKAFAASPYRVRELAVMDIADIAKQSADVITILDVLYLVPIEQWQGILEKCRDCLKPGGRLLLKEQNPAIRWKFSLLHLEETLAVKVLGLTLGTQFTFPQPHEVHALMRRVGFTVEDVPLDRGYFVPHILWVGTKPANS